MYAFSFQKIAPNKSPLRWAPLRHAAERAGVGPPEIRRLTVPLGGAVFHHQAGHGGVFVLSSGRE